MNRYPRPRRFVLTAALFAAAFICAPLMAQDLTVYLVRHAEKDVNQKSDPPLTSAGQQRAQRWVRVFSQVPIAAVYSTDTRRTRDTATPLADANNLELVLYRVGELDASTLMEKHTGGVVFIVGHSNTIPSLVNKLAGQALFQDLDESEYDDLFRISLSKSHSSRQVERLQLPL